QLVRNSVVDDDGDRLALTQGARDRWWQGARVDGAPTRWGTLAIAFERTPTAATWRWTPVPVWTALTLPPGTRLAGEPAPPLVRGERDDLVLAPPGVAAARVAIAATPQQ